MRKDRAMDIHDRGTVDIMKSHVLDVAAHRPGPSTQPAAKKLVFTIWNPNAVQSDDGEVCIWDATDAAITISQITVTLNAAGNEVAGDLKYADTFIGLANAVVINDFDTTSGVRDDSSITSGAVPAGKCLYLSFDSAPDAAITQMAVTIYFTYD